MKIINIKLLKVGQMLSRYEKLEIGSTPNDESCAQVGTEDYYDLAIMEIKAYMHQLQRMFPIPENLQGVVSFVKKSNPHDFGTYYELAIKFPEDNEEAVDYAYNIENNSPANWDEPAKEELRSMGYFDRLNAAKSVNQPKDNFVRPQEALPKSQPALPQPPPTMGQTEINPRNPRDTSSLIGNVKSIKLVKKANVVIPSEVQKVADETGYKINIQPSGVIEFKRPNGHPFYLMSNEPSAFQNALDTMKNETAQSSNRGKAEELARKAEFINGEWQRGGSFGAPYWWMHKVVKVNGIEVGRIQLRKGSRAGRISCYKNSCVEGEDIVWLITQALGDGTLKIEGGLPVTP